MPILPQYMEWVAILFSREHFWLKDEIQAPSLLYCRKILIRWLDGITNSMGRSMSKLRETVKDRKDWCASIPEVTKSWTWIRYWKTTKCIIVESLIVDWLIIDYYWSQSIIKIQKGINLSKIILLKPLPLIQKQQQKPTSRYLVKKKITIILK